VEQRFSSRPAIQALPGCGFPLFCFGDVGMAYLLLKRIPSVNTRNLRAAFLKGP
jgi:hypothetical protein